MANQIFHNGEIDHVYNYDNLFIRTVSVALGRTMSKAVRWINHFEDHKHRVVVPFYYAYIQENFVIDTFVDDILGRRIELDTTVRPRGVIRLKNWAPVSNEFANPNQYLTQKGHVNDDIRSIVSKVRAIPMTINYDVEIFLATQGDAEKCMQKVLNTLFNYKFFRLEYFGLTIDAMFTLPDSATIDISPDKVDFNQDDRYTKVTYSLDVKSYYPSFKVDIDDLQVCVNDNEIDWDFLGVPQPSEDYIETIQKYRGTGGESALANEFGINWNEAFVNRVFWKAYLYETKQREDGTTERINLGKNNIEDDIENKQRRRPS
jgi:hypothetical protein